MLKAMEEVRVLDLADESAVFASRILADLGADVIRVEPPDGGRLRRLAPFLDDEPGTERGLHHLHNNANKRSVTLDIEHPDGAGILRRLAEKADVLLETREPGGMTSLGLGYEELRPVNPELIYVSVTPFGQQGPWHARRANDLVAAAAGGLLHVTGMSDDPPTQGAGDPAYKMASLLAVAGVTVALAGRSAKPGGEHLDISLQEAVVMAMMETGNPNIYTISDRVPGRPGLGKLIYECSDGKWVCIRIRPDRFERLFDWARGAGIETGLKAEDLAELQAGGMDINRRERLTRAVDQIASQVPSDEILQIARDLDLMSLPVGTFPEMQTRDHFVETEQFFEVPHEPLGTRLSFPRSPVAGMAGGVTIRRAPLLGEHNLDVYTELGLSQQDLDRLSEQEVI